MVNRIGTVNSCGSNKGFSSRFYVDYQVWHETPEEGQRTYWPKHCDYNNKDEISSPNILNNWCFYLGRSEGLLYWPRVLLWPQQPLLPHLGWGCSTVDHWGSKALSLQAESHSGILSPTNSNHPWAPGYIIVLTPTCFRCSSTYLHKCISWLTAQLRVNM